VIPAYRITAEAQDVTARFVGRLTSLSVTDQTGGENDSCTITLANGDGGLILPAPGALLKIEMGYLGTGLRHMGDYTLDEVRESSPPRTVSLSAKAAAYSPGSVVTAATPLQTQRERSWDAGKTIADIVRTIAAEAKLTPYITPTAAALVMPHLDQTGESDLAFLTRIASANNSWVKPAFGKLIFAHAADVQTTSALGAPATAPIAVPANQVSTWEFSRKARPHINAVVAVWRDKAAAADKEVRIGGAPQTGDTVQRLEGFTDERTARAAAEARWLDARREGTTFDCALPAPANMPFSAEGYILPQGFGREIDDAPWKLTSVEWNLSDSGFAVSLKCETSTPEKTDAPAE
jgi:phage protein D